MKVEAYLPWIPSSDYGIRDILIPFIECQDRKTGELNRQLWGQPESFRVTNATLGPGPGVPQRHYAHKIWLVNDEQGLGQIHLLISRQRDPSVALTVFYTSLRALRV